MQSADHELARKRASATRPPAAARRPQLRPRHVEVCRAHATRLDAAYGCVDWFIYPSPKHPQ